MGQKSSAQAGQIRLANAKGVLYGRPVRFGYDSGTGLYWAESDGLRHYFGNFPRGTFLYKNGLKARGVELFRSYLMHNIAFEPGDIVIDCGANYADLWLELRAHIAPENYITFEPGRDEFASIVKNAPQARNNNRGLGDKTDTLKFYVNEHDADSSLIEPGHFTEIREVEVVTLTSYIQAEGISAVKVLKLEAEGFEPEILTGAADILPLVSYIAIDGGRERGIAREETFSRQTNFLLSFGFEMVDVSFKWGRALFANRALLEGPDA
ncbi:MAG: FkbM family methyltransferase [Pseudomonadota bacterium]